MEDIIRVLPVDDNPAVLKLITDYFADKPDIMIVGCACDGEQALSMIPQTQPDLLLLDIIMPKLDGFAVLKALGDMPCAPRAIMVTGLSRDDFITRAMQLGASYYMVKPLDLGVLYDRIREIYRMEDMPGAPAEAHHAKLHSTDEQVTNLFLTIGIPAHIKGYQYLREAVRMVLENHDVIGRITKELYPGIARKYDTTASKVERAMRHAIEVAWNRGRLDAINRMYGYKVFSPDDKPTNGEFIAMVADKAAMQKSA
ncbi:MAG: sporulation transcription factor Spo0A [Clostridia bacterium]